MQGRQSQEGGRYTNRFYTLHTTQEVKEILDIVTSMLKVFDVYALLNPGANFSFVTPFLANRLCKAPHVGICKSA